MKPQQRGEMTPEERKMLKELHDALMAAPKTGEPPLIERINGAVVAWERTNFVARFVTTWVLGGIIAIGSAVAVIKGLLPK